MSANDDHKGIAVVGMAGVFPGSNSVEAFWSSLLSERDSFREFTLDEVCAAGLPRDVAETASYVRRCPVICAPETRDAAGLGLSPGDPALADPQQQLLMLCVRRALDESRCEPREFDGTVGLWAGYGFADWALKRLLVDLHKRPEVTQLGSLVAREDPEGIARLARHFDLRGPVMRVQSACSTSLVAVHMAAQALLTWQCDVALAGGVSLQYTRVPGYIYQEGEIFSPDGYCRTFDKGATGTVLGEGCGIVVLRRLEDALTDGQQVLAIIRGSAVNNDGANRAGYTAPGVAGQAELISIAQAAAGVRPEAIGYIEGHGTGTPLGDPIELAALTKVFRATTSERAFCGLGSVKTNVGHLDVAAGVAGLIKTVCALQHGVLPPTQHFREPNPSLQLETSPFFVVDRVIDWIPRDGRRLAGVSSFGLGGTNAHVIVEGPESVSRTT